MKRDKLFPHHVLVGLVLSLILLVGLPCPASAGPLLLVQPSFQMVNEIAGTSRNADINQTYKNATSGPLVSNTGMVTFDGAAVQAIARADYGSLGFYAYAYGVDSDSARPGYEVSASVSGSAQFRDTWRIDNSSLSGQHGLLRLWVEVEGSITGNIYHPGVEGGQSWAVQLHDSYYSQVSSWDWANNTGRDHFSGFLAQDITFQYGVPFDVWIDFMASASNPNWLGPLGIADYLNTMKLSMNKSLVLDDSGQAAVYSLTAASGHDYFDAAPEPVPEPASMLLLGSGLAGLAATLKRRRHR